MLTACNMRLFRCVFCVLFFSSLFWMSPPVLKVPICTQVPGRSASRVLWFTPRLFVAVMATPTPLRYLHVSTLFGCFFFVHCCCLGLKESILYLLFVAIEPPSKQFSDPHPRKSVLYNLCTYKSMTFRKGELSYFTCPL